MKTRFKRLKVGLCFDIEMSKTSKENPETSNKSVEKSSTSEKKEVSIEPVCNRTGEYIGQKIKSVLSLEVTPKRKPIEFLKIEKSSSAKHDDEDVFMSLKVHKSANPFDVTVASEVIERSGRTFKMSQEYLKKWSERMKELRSNVEKAVDKVKDRVLDDLGIDRKDSSSDEMVVAKETDAEQVKKAKTLKKFEAFEKSIATEKLFSPKSQIVQEKSEKSENSGKVIKIDASEEIKKILAQDFKIAIMLKTQFGKKMEKETVDLEKNEKKLDMELVKKLEPKAEEAKPSLEKKMDKPVDKVESENFKDQAKETKPLIEKQGIVDSKNSKASVSSNESKPSLASQTNIETESKPQVISNSKLDKKKSKQEFIGNPSVKSRCSEKSDMNRVRKSIRPPPDPKSFEGCSFAVYGAGKMGEVIVRSLIKKGIPPQKIFVYTKTGRNLPIFVQFGCKVSNRSIDLFHKHRCDVIFLCFHGHVIRECYRSATHNDNLKQPFALTTNFIEPRRNRYYVLSMITGVTLKEVERVLLNPDLKKSTYRFELHRVLITQAHAWCDPYVGIETKINDARKVSPLIRDTIQKFGKVKTCSETKMDKLCVIGGAGLAFTYYIISAWADGGFKIGLKKDRAINLVAKTLMSAAEVVIKSEKNISDLRDASTSPCGPAIYGLTVLDRCNAASGITLAVETAHKRNVEQANLPKGDTTK